MARPSLTKAHRVLLGLVAAGACVISGIGFAGSYNAVKELAEEKGFGAFSYAFPIGVDAGIVVLLALDLVLTWLRIPFPLLRQTAWLLTVATIAFNAAASWGDPLGMGMHAVIPLLFVVVVEASRHAVGRIAAITADRHMESVRVMRWVLSPVPTFRLWRRMKLWELRSYDEVVRLEQNRLVYRAQLRFRYGRGWRRSAPIQALLPLKLAKYGVPLDPAVFDRLDEESQAAREAKEAVEAEARAKALAAQEAQTLAESRAAAALVPAGTQEQGRQEEQPRTEPVPAGPEPLPAEVAAPMLAKLAQVRLRAAQEPEGEDVVPPQPRDELNVWTERAVRTTGHSNEPAPGGRVPGQASPWFKPPRPTDAEEPQAVHEAVVAHGADREDAPSYAEYPEDGFPQDPEFDTPQDFPEEEGVAAERPLRPGPYRLDPELAYQGLVSYMDSHEGQQPNAERLADWLTREFGASGSRPDGSVHPKDVDRLYPELRDRYAASGRD
ncbi:hypothetical protein GCM10009639_14150 [Kitasatospora putterlickiae]|uniref:DUF2637 domain-containing protein n=1 Tax=Kitasatospora putterlickiae TaxID=221725 RepID=A0ABP4IJG5_9ACTN